MSRAADEIFRGKAESEKRKTGLLKRTLCRLRGGHLWCISRYSKFCLKCLHRVESDTPLIGVYRR